MLPENAWVFLSREGVDKRYKGREWKPTMFVAYNIICIKKSQNGNESLPELLTRGADFNNIK